MKDRKKMKQKSYSMQCVRPYQPNLVLGIKKTCGRCMTPLYALDLSLKYYLI